mgnify:CR=1 FL=1
MTYMAEYIFYTTEGYTQAPDGEDVENCQLMGRAFGTDSKDALCNLLANNSWIEEHNFNLSEFICEKLASCQNLDATILHIT